MRRQHLMVISALLVTFLLVTGCSGAATPTVAPTPTPAPTRPAIAQPCTPSPQGAVYAVAEFVVHADRFELVMGTEPFWGYAAGERVSSTAPLGGIQMRVSPGDTIRVGTLRSAATTATHGITIPSLGVDLDLQPGASLANVEIVACEVGTYPIDDYRDPGSHAYADIIVEEAVEVVQKPPSAVSAGPTVYVIDAIVLEDGQFALWMGPEPHWGYGSEARPSTADGAEIVITLKAGDTLKMGGIRQSRSRSSKPHFFSISALGVDIPLAGGNAGPQEFTFEEPGTFLIDDSSDPGEHGVFKVIVEQ